jgi:redox-sensitive bicupin YhaK (pirin superfamily)
MITTRTAKQCGQADFGWLQARYTFSFGHYFDPKLLGYASLRVLNQEVLAPGASFQPRTYPKVDILNLILEGKRNIVTVMATMCRQRPAKRC